MTGERISVTECADCGAIYRRTQLACGRCGLPCEDSDHAWALRSDREVKEIKAFCRGMAYALLITLGAASLAGSVLIIVAALI